MNAVVLAPADIPPGPPPTDVPVTTLAPGAPADIAPAEESSDAVLWVAIVVVVVIAVAAAWYYFTRRRTR